MSKRSFYNLSSAASLTGAPASAIQIEFARRLQRRRTEKGLNQSELARLAAPHMTDKEFNRDSISKYERARILPRPESLEALAKALDCRPEDLLPMSEVPSANQFSPTLDVSAAGDGMAWIRVNASVPMELALDVATRLNAYLNKNKT